MKKLLIGVSLFLVVMVFLSYAVFSQSTKGRFTIGNEPPYVVSGTFAVQEADGSTWDDVSFDTHEDDTKIRFNVKDPNPDNLNVRLCVGTAPDPELNSLCNVVNYDFPVVAPGEHAGSQGEELIYNYNVDPTGTLQGTADTINFLASDCSSEPCSKTYYVDVIIDDNGGEVVTTSYQFDLTDYSPTFVDLQLSDSVSGLTTCTQAPTQFCWITPLQGDYTSVEAKLTIDDQDADCSDLNHDATIVLCLEDYATGGACDTGQGVFRSYDLSFAGMTGSECDFTISIPSGDAVNGIVFFEAPGNYKAYAEAVSQTGNLLSGFTTSHGWQYSSLPNIEVPATVLLGDDNIQLGSWNPGTSLATFTNKGNVLLTLDWDATDPEEETVDPKLGCSGHTTTCWDLSTADDLQIDDDSDLTDDTGNLAVANIPETGVSTVNFNPVGGLAVCDAFDCNNPALEETLDVYFHIKPPVGLQPGNYETDIRVTI